MVFFYNFFCICFAGRYLKLENLNIIIIVGGDRIFTKERDFLFLLCFQGVVVCNSPNSTALPIFLHLFSLPIFFQRINILNKVECKGLVKLVS